MGRHELLDGKVLSCFLETIQNSRAHPLARYSRCFFVPMPSMADSRGRRVCPEGQPLTSASIHDRLNYKL